MILTTEHLHDLACRTAGAGPAQTANIWVPSERISSHSLPVPSAPERKWPELLPWMMEDRVLQATEQMHFSILGRQDPKHLLVAAVSRADLNQWLSLAAGAGVAPRVMVPDYLALPWEEGRWSVYWREGVCLVRTGVLTGFAAPAAVAWPLLEAELSGLPLSPGISISVPDGSLVPQSLRRQADINSATINWAFTEVPAAVNLLTGPFRPLSESFDWRTWLPTAALGAVVLLLAAVNLLVATQVSRGEVEQLRTEVARTYQQLFPGQAASEADLRGRAEADISRLFRQRQGLDAAPFRLLQVLDGLMSGCACDLQEVKVEGATATLRFRPRPELRQQLNQLNGVRLQWQDPDPQGLVAVQIRAEAG